MTNTGEQVHIPTGEGQRVGAWPGDRPSPEPRAEVVELTPEEVQFIDAWRLYWRGGSVNGAESAVFDDIARKVLGDGFVRQRPAAEASAFLAPRPARPRARAPLTARVGATSK